MLIYAVGLEQDWQGARPWEGPKAIRYQAAAKSSSIVMVASSHLQKHGNVMNALRSCTAGGKRSLVTERPADPGSSLVQHLDELPSVRQFLHKQRRIIRRGATGRFDKKMKGPSVKVA